MSKADYLGPPVDVRVSPEQKRCDSIQAEFRAVTEQASADEAVVPLDPALMPTDDRLRLRLAEELESARAMLDEMGDELAGDMAVVMRHTVALQTIDVVGQMLGHIAAVTRSAAPASAVEQIGMSELRGRLKLHVS